MPNSAQLTPTILVKIIVKVVFYLTESQKQSNEQGKLHVAVAHDGGNGYMKDAINGRRFIFPSVLARVLPGNEPSRINASNFDNVHTLLEHFVNHMDITVQSGGVKENGRYLVGYAAQNSGSTLVNFNVNSTQGKHSSDVSIVSLLALVAYDQLYQYQRRHHSLPSSLGICVDKMVTALPIEEVKIHGVRDEYINRFIQQDHVIIINSFNQPISVHIHFDKVDVQPEGVIAQYGLIGNTAANTGFRNDSLFDKFRERYGYQSFTGKDILKAGNILGIDIGDGTVDFSVLNGTSPVPQLNSSIFMGIGNVTENAADALHQKYPMLGKINRQTYMKIARRGQDRESQAFRDFLNEQFVTLDDQIVEQVQTIYAKLNNQIDMIVVSGGGATALKNNFASRLSQTIDNLSPFGAVPILWVPPKYAQTLNLDGLQFRLNHM